MPKPDEDPLTIKSNNVNIHIHQTAARNRNNKILEAIRELREELMAKMQDFQAAFQQVDAETTRIGDYIQKLVAQLNRQDLTDEQEGQLLTSLNAAGERLKAVGISPEEPIPTEPLPDIPV